jgi:hypothetical protein
VSYTNQEVKIADVVISKMHSFQGIFNKKGIPNHTKDTGKPENNV